MKRCAGIARTRVGSCASRLLKDGKSLWTTFFGGPIEAEMEPDLVHGVYIGVHEFSLVDGV